MKQLNNKLQQIISIFLTVSAAALLSAACIKTIRFPFGTTIIRQPSFEEPDIYNNRLNQLQINLSTIDEYLAPEVPLRYVGLSNEYDELQRAQAILAPRRVGPDVESPFIFVCASYEEFQQLLPTLGDVQLVVRLFDDVAIFKKRFQN